jgi:uncharacterized protein
MRTVFADANYWIGLLNPKDQLHELAMTASRKLVRTRIVTSEMVLVEVLNGLAEVLPLRSQVVSMVDAINSNPNTEVAPQTAVLFRQAYALYREREDKEWGLTDCSSFVIMRLRGLTEALTYDRHFEQAGFTALLRSVERA